MPRSLCSPPPAVAVLRHDLPVGSAVPTALRLIPAGAFSAPDGRPADAPAWVLDDADGQRLVAEMAARQSARYIDYEHATLHAKSKGTPAPAAGWFDALEWRPGSGLWAVDIDWTPAAARMIQDREYRYISPLFSYQPGTGRVLQLLGASLTNDPGLDGLTDLAALAAPLLNPLETEALHDLMKKLFQALAIADQPADDLAALTLAIGAATALQSRVAALVAQTATPPDPGQYVPIATLAALQADHTRVQGELAELQRKIQADQVEQAIAQATAAGKLPPALLGWARTLGQRDLAALTTYLDAAPVLAALQGTQTGGQAPGKTDPLDARQIADAALAYQTTQRQSGIDISTPAAVAHIVKTQSES